MCTFFSLLYFLFYGLIIARPGKFVNTYFKNFSIIIVSYLINKLQF
nr:MAG TPA: hypothetical protein [Caudoviricetes sp.]